MTTQEIDALWQGDDITLTIAEVKRRFLWFGPVTRRIARTFRGKLVSYPDGRETIHWTESGQAVESPKQLARLNRYYRKCEEMKARLDSVLP